MKHLRPGHGAAACLLTSLLVSPLLAPTAVLAQDVFVLPPLNTPDNPVGTQTITVQKVSFTGNTVISTGELQALAAPYLGRPISTDDVEALRQTLSRLYVDRGYVNSGVLRNPNNANNEGAASDTLAFDVIEGRLTAIRLRGMGRLDERYVTRRLSRDLGRDTDGPFNMEVLRERYQLLLTDPLIEHMNSRLMPGEQPGEATLDVDVTLARPYQFTVFANNYRPPSVGANAIGVNASFRNLTSYGDLLEASLHNAPPSGVIGRASLAWSLPLGFSGTRFSLALDQGDSAVVEQPAAALGITSQLTSVDAGLSHTLAESLTHKFTLGLNHVRRESRTLLLGTPFSFTANEPEGVTRETLWRFWQDYSYRTPSQVLALRSTFTQGRNNLVDAAGLPTASDSAARSFSIWMGQLQWARQVAANGAQAVARVTVQRSADRLLALDGLSVGGVNSVRGFRENELVRDEGEYINLEFDYPALRNAAGLNVNLIPFLDYGSARNLRGPSSTLSSAGLALRLLYKAFTADLVLAKRLQQPDTTTSAGATLQDAGIHLQVAWKF